jgi:hypothetical protein
MQRDALDSLLDRPLAAGAHTNPQDGACVIEWLRLHEGQDFNDQQLPCQSPVMHRALVYFNDRMPDGPRQALKLIALKSLGTVADGRDQWRAYRLADVACREWAPIALDAQGFGDHAATLRALPPVRTRETAARAKDAAYAAAAADAYAAAAYAAADAAAAADAYAAAAYAAADAAYAAADADAAAYAAAAAAAAAGGVWPRAIELLEDLVSDVA